MVKSKFEILRRRIVDFDRDDEVPAPAKRKPVTLKVLEDIPMAYWQVRCPVLIVADTSVRSVTHKSIHLMFVADSS